MYVHNTISLSLSISLQFETDVKLIFNNCKEYNGDGSEYSDLANQMLQELDKLCKVHLDGGGVKVRQYCHVQCYSAASVLCVSVTLCFL